MMMMMMVMMTMMMYFVVPSASGGFCSLQPHFGATKSALLWPMHWAATTDFLNRKRSYAGVVFTRFCGLWFSAFFFENVGCFEERV